MLFKLIAVGKCKDRMIEARCEEYGRWLTPYGKFEARILPDSTPEKEAAQILAECEKERGAYRFVLSEEGTEFSTETFSRKLASIDRKILFIIGGPLGLMPQVKAAADCLWSLSPLTFTHELARLLLMEQLFRAENYLHGGHYHNAGALSAQSGKKRS